MMNVVGTKLKEDGTHTDSPEETLQTLLRVHFPDCHMSTSQNKTKIDGQEIDGRLKK